MYFDEQRETEIKKMGKSIVLNFHNEQNSSLIESILLALKARYRIISLEELESLLEQKGELEDICHISFDDGERSFYEVIYPLLKKHQVPVSLFLSPQIISTGRNFWFQEMKYYDSVTLKKIIAEKQQVPVVSLEKFTCTEICKSLSFAEINEIMEAYKKETGCEEKKSMNMSPEEVREVDRSGLVTIGAHTVNHPVLKNESNVGCQSEMKQSIAGLEQMLGHSIKYFAYPNGRPGIDFGKREMSILSENRITLAFSTELDHLSPHVNRLCIPRISFPRMGLSPNNPLIYFRLSLGKRWPNIKSIGKPSEQEIRKQLMALFGKKHRANSEEH